MLLYSWSNYVQRLLYPPRCIFCNQGGQIVAGQVRDLCLACEHDLVANGVACQRCAEPIHHPGLCPACLKKAPPQDSAWAAYRYHFPLDRLVTGFKFEQRPANGRVLAQLFEQALAAAELPEVDCVIPVPLHTQRYRQRGFNQAEVLLERVTRRYRIDTESVTRARVTQNQSSLALADRHRNIKGAFSALRDFHGQRIAIVDDVMTSGSTVAELARLLKRRGAREVHIWVLARAAVRRGQAS